MAAADFCAHGSELPPTAPPFGQALLTGTRHRPPRIRTWTFAAQARHLPWGLSGTVSLSTGSSPQGPSRPIWRFCS